MTDTALAIQHLRSNGQANLMKMSEAQIAKIVERLPEADRARHTAGRRNTAHTSQLMSLTMLTDSSYRRLRQCLAQIEKKRRALDENFFKMRKTEVRVRNLREKGDELSLIRAQELEHKSERGLVYIEGALKEIGIFQDAYDEIIEAHNIPVDWDERDSEMEEAKAHMRQAFRQAHRDMVNGGSISLGDMEYLEQYGIHIQTAERFISEYIHGVDELIKANKLVPVTHLYEFLDRMAEIFEDAHKDVMEHIGLKQIIRDDFLYLEDKTDGVQNEE